jgi:hypothetical protein
MIMNKTKLNFWLDLTSLALLVILASTGLIMEYVLPPGQGRMGGEHPTLLGAGRHDIGAFHFTVAVLLLASIAAHLIMHWPWIVCRYKEWKEKRADCR